MLFLEDLLSLDGLTTTKRVAGRTRSREEPASGNHAKPEATRQEEWGTLGKESGSDLAGNTFSKFKLPSISEDVIPL